MATVYVTGHRNPDTDSIASAIGYAQLKRRLDPRNCRIGRRGSRRTDCGHRLANCASTTTTSAAVTSLRADGTHSPRRPAGWGPRSPGWG